MRRATLISVKQQSSAVKEPQSVRTSLPIMHLKIGVCFYVTLVSIGVLALPASRHDAAPQESTVSCPDLNPPKSVAYFIDVMNALDSDSSFEDRYLKLSEKDVMDGEIGPDLLESISPSVQTSLNELKKRELRRLGTQNGSATNYLDYQNPNVFGLLDLQKLHIRHTKDFAAFHLDFNSNINFYLHDLDLNGVWSENEVKAFVKDTLQKTYLVTCMIGMPASAFGRAMLQRGWRQERRNTMKALEIMDANHDGLVSLEEFQSVLMTIMSWDESHDNLPFPMEKETM